MTPFKTWGKDTLAIRTGNVSVAPKAYREGSYPMSQAIPPSEGAALLEKRIAAMEQGIGACWTHAGVPFLTDLLSLLANHLQARKIAPDGSYHVLAAQSLGHLWRRALSNLERLGHCQVTWLDSSDFLAWEAAIQPGTSLFLVDSMFFDFSAAPRILHSRGFSIQPTVWTDLSAFSKLARTKNTLLIVDNSMATAAASQPIQQGADWVVYSDLRILLGTEASSVVDQVIAIGAERMIDLCDNPEDTVESQEQENLYPDLSPWLTKLRALREKIAPSMVDSFEGHTALWRLGLETLEVRLARQKTSAQKIAQLLRDNQLVHSVYPSNALNSELEKDQGINQATVLMEDSAVEGNNGCVMFALNYATSGAQRKEPGDCHLAGRRFLEYLRLFRLVAVTADSEKNRPPTEIWLDSNFNPNVSYAMTIANPDDRATSSVAEHIHIFLWIGLEAVDDLWADLSRALYLSQKQWEEKV